MENICRIYTSDTEFRETAVGSADGIVRIPAPENCRKIEFLPAGFKVSTGSEGYFLIPNVKSPCTPGGLIFFREREDITEEYTEGFAMPVFGVNTGDRGVLAVVTSCRYDYSLKVTVEKGFYQLSVIFTNFGTAPEIRLFSLHGKAASYSGMAACYRNFQLQNGTCRTLKERCEENPILAESVRSIMVRIRMGWKPVPPAVLEQTDETAPPVKTAVTFRRAAEILKRCKEKGIEHAEFCLVGWNKGGHDGAFPDLFPVEEAFGGEKELRKLLEYAGECGYRVSAHTNLVDSYSISKRCTPDDRLIDEDGSYHLGGAWAGGQSYYLCPKRAFEKFAAEDFAAMKELGFSGTHYLDVASIKLPDACFSKDHPLTKEEGALWRSKTLRLAREVFGASSSEGAIDFCIGDMDYVLYATFTAEIPAGPVLFDRSVPFWALVYHGIVSCNCSFCTINEMVKDDPDLFLDNLEWGGRPAGYFHSKFRPATDNADADLRCTTDEELEQGTDALARRAKQFYTMSHLQLEFIEEHDEIAPGVIRERFSDGTVVIINRTDRHQFGTAPHSFTWEPAKN